MSIDQIRTITTEKRWGQEAQVLLSNNIFSSEFVKDFHTVWIESGHHIRSQIGNDTLLVSLLERILPKYEGGLIRLYRGENQSRWSENIVGLAWTTSIDVARMFGSGLNAYSTGGLLLSCDFHQNWIISQPNKHSIWLGENEYTVNPFKVSGITVLERYPVKA